MKYVKWIPQVLLIVAFGASGLIKVFTPYEDMLSQMPWVEDFSASTVKTIGALEFLGALGLFLPVLLKRYTFFVPLAAIGLALTMIVAIFVHINRGEPFVPNIVLLLLSLIVVWLRWGSFRSGSGQPTG